MRALLVRGAWLPLVALALPLGGCTTTTTEQEAEVLTTLDGPDGWESDPQAAARALGIDVDELRADAVVWDETGDAAVVGWSVQVTDAEVPRRCAEAAAWLEATAEPLTGRGLPEEVEWYEEACRTSPAVHGDGVADDAVTGSSRDAHGVQRGAFIQVSRAGDLRVTVVAAVRRQ